MKYGATKTYGHDIGLSVCFRQHAATHSHCKFLHGYAIAVRLEFMAEELDHRNWVIDFGGLKEIKIALQDQFDHKLCIDEADPYLRSFKDLAMLGLCELRIMQGVGCEKFAEWIFKHVSAWLIAERHNTRVQLVKVEVSEHGGNSASVIGE